MVFSVLVLPLPGEKTMNRFIFQLAGILICCTYTSAEVRWTHLSSDFLDLPVPFAGPEPTASLLLDLDQDGSEDILIGARNQGPCILWYQRTKGHWRRHIIDSSMQRIEAGGAGLDIDRDGDLDFVFGADAGDNRIWWWENPYPEFGPDRPWIRRMIKDDGGNKHHDQIFGDFDADGEQELVSWNQNSKSLLFFEIPRDAKSVEPWPYQAIYSWSDEGEHEGLASADINLDGIEDIVGGGRWFEYLGDRRFQAHIIDDEYRFSRALAGQFIRGGFPEVVFGPGDNVLRLRIYSWDGAAWSGRDLLPEEINHGHSLQAGDVDGDGNLDLFVAEMGQWSRRVDNPLARMYLLYGNGQGEFRVQLVQQGQGTHESRLGDVDGDGDLDILGKAFRHNSPRLDIWRNDGLRDGDLPLNRWKRRVIDSERPHRAVWIRAADLDGDGWKDVAAGAWWYRNPGGSNDSWVREPIGFPFQNVSLIYDFDWDGFYDILGRSAAGADSGPNFLLARNRGFGRFEILETPGRGQGDFEQGVVVDFFEPGPRYQVAVSWHKADQGIQLLTPRDDPVAEIWDWRKISEFSQDEALSAGDVDRDGDRDLLLGTRWLRNDGNSWSLRIVNPVQGDPDRNRLVDMNRDGLLDAVVGFEAINKPGKLAWYEQPEDLDEVWSEHLVGFPVGPMSLSVTDLDGDGDPDLVVGEHNYESPSTAKLLLFENLDGRGGQWHQHIVYTGDEHHDGALTVDIDADGDWDIVSIGWSHPNVILYENLALP